MIIFHLPLIFLVLFLSILPIVWSFFPVLGHESLKLFKEIWFDGSFRVSNYVAYFTSLLSTFLALFLGIRLGFVMSECGSKKRNFLYSLTMFVWILPYYVVIPFLRLVLDFMDPNIFYNPFLAFAMVVLVKTLMNIPMVAFMSLAISRGIPSSIRDSLVIDGANRSEMFSAVYSKRIRNTLKPYTILLMISGMRDVGVPLLLTGGGPMLRMGFSSFGVAGITTTFGIFLKTSIDTMQEDPIFLTKSALVSSILVFTFLTLWALHKGWKLIYPLLGIMELLWFGWIGFILFFFLILYWKLERRWIKAIYLISSFTIGVFHHFLSPSFLSLVSYHVLIGMEREEFEPRRFPGEWMEHISTFSWILITMFVFFIILSSALTDLPDLGFSGLLRFNLEGFEKLWKDHFHLNMLNSLMIGMGSGVLTTFLILLSIVPMAEGTDPLSGMTKIMLSTTLMLTGMNTLLPLFIIFRKMGILNSYISVILVTVNRSLPMTYFIIMEDVKRMKSIAEQAFIDGAGGIPLAFKVIYPVMLPSILVCFSYSFIKGWTNFIVPLIFFSNPKMFPISVKLFEYAGDPTLQYTYWNTFAFGGLIATSIVALLSLIIRNRISGDITVEEI